MPELIDFDDNDNDDDDFDMNISNHLSPNPHVGPGRLVSKHSSDVLVD